MRTVDLLRQVRDCQEVSVEDLKSFVRGVSTGEIPEYQAAAFCMAVYLQGLSDKLTVALTEAMRDSGQVIDLSHVHAIKVDKHSTGGVGDKISIPLAPLVAACGVPVPMISGRGLGHTGGTLDKLESIPGFRVDLSIDRFKQLVQELGVCLIGQTGDLAPADRKLYALRDVTSTVESVPLITSSILSKKLAEGINALVLDVKVGKGAFMKDKASAMRLAKSLVRVGTGAGLKVMALLTNMEQPLGTMIGNALEIRESIDILRGQGPKDTTALTLAFGAEMLVLGKKAKTRAEAQKMLVAAQQSGAGLDKLRQLIAAQGGNPNVVDNPSLLPTARATTPVPSPKSGYVAAVDAYAVGTAGMRLGAGRAKAEDKVDPAVGIEMLRKVGDKVKKGEPIAIVHHNGPGEQAVVEVAAAYRFSAQAPRKQRLIVGRVG